MKTFVLTAALTFAACPAFAQANANLAPGGIVDGTKAGINDAEGTAPNGQPSPGERQVEGKQSETSGSKMVKQGDSGAQPPAKVGTSDKP